jgi:hypothetical protein
VDRNAPGKIIDLPTVKEQGIVDQDKDLKIYQPITIVPEVLNEPNDQIEPDKSIES